MEFLKRLIVVGVIYLPLMFIVEKTGVKFGSVKFEVIALIYFWAVVFYILHEYMFFIAIEETIIAGLADNNTKGAAWKLLGVLFAIVGTGCWVLW